MKVSIFGHDHEVVMASISPNAVIVSRSKTNITNMSRFRKECGKDMNQAR